MNYTQRKELIVDLERIRGSKILSYILSDRETFPPNVPGFGGLQLANEPQLHIIDQLRAIGKSDKLDLFLYTRGGDTNSVWPLINVLREYCTKLTIIIPFRAHSAGTLMCLGADEVIMTEIAELSPIDPTTTNAFNPKEESNSKVPKGISVEDVTAYFKLARDRGGIISEAERLEVFKELTRRIDPLALGNVERVYMQIRQLAHRLLSLHIDEKREAQKFLKIIEALTEKFYSHLHVITRAEAIELMGEWVKAPSEGESALISTLFNSYAETFNLRTKFSLPDYMTDDPIRELKILGGLIESRSLSHAYVTAMNVIQRPNLPTNVQIQLQPGTPIPLSPVFGRAYDFTIQRAGWELNAEEA